jgi:glycosyltransferase involved in cell wall biosynthesis
MTNRLKVLFQSRPNIFEARGGDTIQLEGTRKYLTKLGVSIDWEYSDRIDCSAYDLIHLFNITRPEETWLQLQNAKYQRKPIFLSTIYWNMDKLKEEEYQFVKHKSTFKDLIRSAARASLRFVNKDLNFKYRNEKLRGNNGVYDLQKKILQNVDVLLPNSIAERELIHRDFPFTQNKPSYIVSNCIDFDLFNNINITRDWGIKRNLDVFILCVGRIEPRKNQLRLVQAMRESEIPVVMIGRQMSPEYYRLVKQSMKLSDVLIEEVGQKQLKQIYAAARVHVLPSIYETPGLASLEAGVMGCNIVTSEIGSQREYFGDMVEYCNPYDLVSINNAVRKALHRKWPNEIMQRHIQDHYRWEVAAKQTLEAYQMATVNYE